MQCVSTRYFDYLQKYETLRSLGADTPRDLVTKFFPFTRSPLLFLSHFFFFHYYDYLLSTERSVSHSIRFQCVYLYQLCILCIIFIYITCIYVFFVSFTCTYLYMYTIRMYVVCIYFYVSYLYIYICIDKQKNLTVQFLLFSFFYVTLSLARLRNLARVAFYQFLLFFCNYIL